MKKAAREMNRKAFAEKLREIKMSEYDSQMYEQYSMGVRRQVQSIRNILDSLQAKSADRWEILHYGFVVTAVSECIKGPG